MGKKVFAGINLIRIVACLIIVSFHYYTAIGGGFFATNDFINYIVSNGSIMVNLFFMISGFCIAVNYKEKLLSDLSFSDYFVKHYVKFVALSLITIPFAIAKQIMVYQASLDPVYVTFTDIIKDCLCIRFGWFSYNSMPYNGSLWFVDILLVMYLFYYICCKFKKHYTIASIAFFVLGLFLSYNKGVINLPLINDGTASGFMNFFAGVLLYELYLTAYKNKKSIIAWGAIFGSLSVCGYGLNLLNSTIDITLTFLGDYSLFLVFAVWPFLIWTAIFFSPMEKLANTKVMQFLYKNTTYIYISSPLYLDTSMCNNLIRCTY